MVTNYYIVLQVTNYKLLTTILLLLLTTSYDFLVVLENLYILLNLFIVYMLLKKSALPRITDLDGRIVEFAKSFEEFGLCPYCSPYCSNRLRWDPSMRRVFCSVCNYRVLILGLNEV